MSKPSSVVREFPRVEPTQAVVVYLHKTLGCVLTTSGEIFKGGEDPVHVICSGVAEAHQHARDIVARMPHVICAIYDSTGKEIEYVG